MAFGLADGVLRPATPEVVHRPRPQGRALNLRQSRSLSIYTRQARERSLETYDRQACKIAWNTYAPTQNLPKITAPTAAMKSASHIHAVLGAPRRMASPIMRANVPAIPIAKRRGAGATPRGRPPGFARL